MTKKKIVSDENKIIAIIDKNKEKIRKINEKTFEDLVIFGETRIKL